MAQTMNPNPERLLDLSFASVFVLPRLLMSPWQPRVERVTTATQAMVLFTFPKGELIQLLFVKGGGLALRHGYIDLMIGSELSQDLENELRAIEGLPDDQLVDHLFAGVTYGRMRCKLELTGEVKLADCPVDILALGHERSALRQILHTVFADNRADDCTDLYELVRPTIEGLRQRDQQ